MIRATDYELEGLRLLLIHRMVGQVLVNIKEGLEQGNSHIDISQFSDALEGSADVLLLSPRKLHSLSKGYRPSAKGKRAASPDTEEVVAAGLKEAAAGIRAASDAILQNQPDGLPYFAAGLIVSWNAALSVINSSLRTLIQQYPGISPVLAKEDHRVDKVARIHREWAEYRDEEMRSALEPVLVRMAQKQKSAGVFDPAKPPIKAAVANTLSEDRRVLLSPSTISNRISARDIREIWRRQAG